MKVERYTVPVDDVKRFVRAARKVERELSRKGGSRINPVFALEEIEKIIASGETWRETDELGEGILIPALPRPTLAEIQAKYPFVKEIERDTSPMDARVMTLATTLRPTEGSMPGAEYERRIQPKFDVILGYQQAKWLVEHQDEFPALVALLGKVYIDFAGMVVVHGDGGRVFPDLRQVGGRWYLRWRWLDDRVYRFDRVASSRKQQAA